MSVDISTYGGLLQPIGLAGQMADGNNYQSYSKTNDQALAIDFGVAVARSASDETCKAPTADGDKIIGISIRLATKVADVNGNVTYGQYDILPINRTGDQWVVAFENATRGDIAISVTAQNGKLGSTTGGAAAAGRIALDGTGDKPRVRWETTTAAGQIGRISVNT